MKYTFIMEDLITGEVLLEFVNSFITENVWNVVGTALSPLREHV